MTVKSYLVSLPERVVRSTVAVGGGTVRELAEVALPRSVRCSQIYQNVVDGALLFLIEHVGEVEPGALEGTHQDDLFLRRTVGNAFDLVGVTTFHTSPIWVLAVTADLCGAGRYLIPEIADALKTEGLLDREATFTTIDHVLDGLEKTSTKLAQTVSTPPLDVAQLRAEWDALQATARGILPDGLPTRDAIGELWSELKTEAARQERSVFDLSTLLSVTAMGRVPDAIRWTKASARVSARRTGQVVAAKILDDYRQTLSELKQVGFVSYAQRQCKPYFRAAAKQFSPRHRTTTERLLDELETRRRRHLPEQP